MFKRLLLIATLGWAVSGCYMVPMALIGPITSGYSTASLIQSGFATGANLVVKRSTGKAISEHIFDSINQDVLKQTYFPKKIVVCKKYDYYCKRINSKKY